MAALSHYSFGTGDLVLGVVPIKTRTAVTIHQSSVRHPVNTKIKSYHDLGEWGLTGTMLLFSEKTDAKLVHDAIAVGAWNSSQPEVEPDDDFSSYIRKLPIKRVEVALLPKEPTEEMWGNDLVRQILNWLSFERPTPGNLLKHLDRTVDDAEWEWIKAELGGSDAAMDHVVDKGTRAVILYKAMTRKYDIGTAIPPK